LLPSVGMSHFCKKLLKTTVNLMDCVLLSNVRLLKITPWLPENKAPVPEPRPSEHGSGNLWPIDRPIRFAGPQAPTFRS